MLRLRARGLSAMLLSFVSNVSSLPAPSAAGYSSPANVEWSIFLLVSFDIFFRSLSISSLYVHDTDVFRVFCRPAIFVSTDGVASGVAPGGFSQCRCWGLDEGDVAALCHSHRLVFIYGMLYCSSCTHRVPLRRSCPRVWAAAAVSRNDCVSQVRPGLHLLPGDYCHPCRRFFPKSYRSLFPVQGVVLRSVSCGVSRVAFIFAACPSDPGEVHHQSRARMFQYRPALPRFS